MYMVTMYMWPVGQVIRYTRATLWVNGQPQALSNVASEANSVYVSGGNVYVVGITAQGSTSWINGAP